MVGRLPSFKSLLERLLAFFAEIPFNRSFLLEERELDDSRLSAVFLGFRLVGLGEGYSLVVIFLEEVVTEVLA